MNLKPRFSDLPLNLQHDVLQNILDIECKPADLTQYQLNTLNALSPEELWNSYLEWNGLVNWAGPLVRAHAEIFEEPVLHDRFSDLPANIQSDLIQNKFDYDCTLEQLTLDQLDSMNAMSPKEMWAGYLDYNGIIGWAGALDQAHQAVFASAPDKALQASTHLTELFNGKRAFQSETMNIPGAGEYEVSRYALDCGMHPNTAALFQMLETAYTFDGKFGPFNPAQVPTDSKALCEAYEEFASEFNDRLSALGIDKFGIVGAEYLNGAASLESDEDLIAIYEAELNNFGKLLLVADKMTTEYGSNADINFLVDLDKVSQLVDVILDANFRRNGGINKIVELQANLEERHQTLGDYADTAVELENLGYEGTDLVDKMSEVATGIPAIKASLESGLLQTKEHLERFLSAKPTDTPKAMLKR
ncbi:MAG: hypothetical protein JZU65_17505 [Chlorobium sp.]|nr:hypothetical protein [Chlorobium sp.]